MVTPELVKPTEEVIRGELGNCLGILGEVDNLLATNANIGSLENRLARFNSTKNHLDSLLRASDKFGRDYCDDLNHDLAFYPNGIESGIKVGEDAYPACRNIVKGIRHVLGSVAQEFHVDFKTVDIAQIANESFDCAIAGPIVAPLGGNKHKIDFLSQIDPQAAFVNAQSDLLSRIVDNCVINSERAVRFMLGNRRKVPNGFVLISTKTVGKKIELSVSDNGIGLGEEFEEIGLVVTDNRIPLTEALELGLGGKRRGFKVCERLAGLLKTEVHITNPNLRQGSEITILLDAA